MKTKTTLLAAGLAVSLCLGGLIAQTDKQTPTTDTQSMGHDEHVPRAMPGNDEENGHVGCDDDTLSDNG